MRSLRSRLWVLWALASAASIIVGLLLYQLYEASTSAQVERAEAVVARACSTIRDRYAAYVAGAGGGSPSSGAPGLRRDLAGVVSAALAGETGIEGGIWSADSGSLAYAFPTYAGTGAKTDLPQAEAESIAAINRQAAQADRAVVRASAGGTQTLLLSACPFGPYRGLTAWTMTRVQGAPGYDRLRIGVAVLCGLVLGMAGWLTWLTSAWARHVGAIETALARHNPEALPRLAPTGERELDRIIAALNDAGERLAQARRRSEELAARAAAAERLAALGRVAAGLAHEIRNPLAAMRLKTENALAADDGRRRQALAANLAQIARLDRLVGELMTMTQKREPRPEPTELPAFLAARLAEHREIAETHGAALSLECPPVAAKLDPSLVGRVLDNLLLNALQHTPAGGRVTLAAEVAGNALRISVADTGAGVAPQVRDHLFEPFVTGRSEGTGLGLAIACELAQAHGGSLTLADRGGAERRTVFVLELPWQES